VTCATLYRICALAILTATLPACSQNIPSTFLHPPASARPMVRWWWFGPAVTKEEISRELKQMSADGIGGAELAFVYPLQLNANLPFGSPAMLEMVHYAEDEGFRLGLRIDVTLCSGWPYGGPHITLDNAATRIRTVEIPVAAESTLVNFPVAPAGDTFL
jgi:hypothetical protein